MDYGKIVAEALDEVAAMPLPLTDLQRHDAKYHPDGYDEKHDYCTYRERLKKGDRADTIDPESVEGEWQSIYDVYQARRKKHGDIPMTKEESRAKRFVDKKAIKAKKLEEREKRAREVNQKTLSELTHQYTKNDEQIVNEALEYSINGDPVFEISIPDARSILVETIHGDPKQTKKNFVDRFANFGNRIYVNFIGEISIDKKSVNSIIGHNANGWHIAKVVAIEKIKDLLDKSKNFSLNRRWKNRSYDAVSYVAPFKIGLSEYIAEITLEFAPRRESASIQCTNG